MKKKWKNRYSRFVAPLLAFGLAVCAVISTPPLDGRAQAVDVNKSCTLTVHPGSEGLAGELAQAQVVIDLYKVADAVADSSYDTYSYRFLDGYTGLKVPDQPSNAQWKNLSQEAARIALNGGTPVISGAEAGKETAVPGCGLYLIIARGSSNADYITTVKDENGRETIATTAHSGEYTYTFPPSLISLPSKEADADGNITTDGPGEWLYNFSVTLKPEQEIRYGSLEIVKTLQTYETKDPATFVFQVEATLGEGESAQKVYSDVVSLSFTAPGQETELIKKLPVGAHVTVTEIYSGAVYSLVTADTQTAVIPANDVVSVAFTNDYNNTNKGGGAVTNRFDYGGNGEENQGEDRAGAADSQSGSGQSSGWHWTQISDDE